jgi:transposase
MYRDVAQWSGIRYQILERGTPIRQVVRESGISRTTVRKMLRQPCPEPYQSRSRVRPKLGQHIASIRRLLNENAALLPSAQVSLRVTFERLRDELGFSGTYATLQRYARSITPGPHCIGQSICDLLISLEQEGPCDLVFLMPATSRLLETDRVVRTATKPDLQVQARQAAFEWMHAVLQNKASHDALRRQVGDIPGFESLLDHLYDGRLSDRNRAVVVLASRCGLSKRVICRFLRIGRNTVRRYVRTFDEGGHAALFARQIKSTRKFESEAVKQAVFGLLHQPPSNHGINRTTWIMADLVRILKETGQPVCSHVIRKITTAAGYRWRKARVVLTSTDPDYAEKLARIQAILSGLGPAEAFFSIDEFGPFAVKIKAGRALTAPGEQRIVPQWQKSRGCLIMTAALELSANQITHFYSTRKNTAEMIRMLELLIERYCDREKLYLSWDAASWHISKRFQQHVDEHNTAVIMGHPRPLVETAPLPSGAQFLNVIESVFSGLARAIIHNSDYGSTEEAIAAIDRHFEERNAHFLLHPQKAGRKIWGKEREAAVFSAANNCKDPSFR